VESNVPSLHGFRNDPIGFAAGEYLPLPRSKGGAFPFLLTSMGAPLPQQIFAQEQWIPPKSEETRAIFYLDNIFKKFYKNNHCIQTVSKM